MSTLYIKVIAILLLAGAAFGWSAWERASGVKQGRAAVQQQWDADKMAQSAAALKAITEINAAHRKQLEEITNAATDAAKKVDASRRAIAAGAADRERLRDKLASLSALCDSGGSASATPVAGNPAATPGALLSDMYRRTDDAAQELAVSLDATHAAATACVTSYNSLRDAK